MVLGLAGIYSRDGFPSAQDTVIDYDNVLITFVRMCNSLVR